MAHQCPTCSNRCHCGGDIDDLCLGEGLGCTCCEISLEDAEYTESELKQFEGERVFEFSEDESFGDVEFETKAKDVSSALALFHHHYGYHGYFMREKKSTTLKG